MAESCLRHKYNSITHLYMYKHWKKINSKCDYRSTYNIKNHYKIQILETKPYLKLEIVFIKVMW